MQVYQKSVQTLGLFHRWKEEPECPISPLLVSLFLPHCSLFLFFPHFATYRKKENGWRKNGPFPTNDFLKKSIRLCGSKHGCSDVNPVGEGVDPFMSVLTRSQPATTWGHGGSSCNTISQMLVSRGVWPANTPKPLSHSINLTPILLDCMESEAIF